MDITRGIIARMLGFSTVEVQTAGYSAPVFQYRSSWNKRGHPQSEGHIPAVSAEGAEQIREFLMSKVSGKNLSQGL